MKRWIIILASFTLFLITIEAIANRVEPVPIYGSYIRVLDRSKQTFNGKMNPNNRPSTQKEVFSTMCEPTGCIAHTPNLYAPPGAPQYIDYHWNNNRWELSANHFFHCNDGTQVNSVLSEFFISNVDGSFTGERSIEIDGKGCKGEGPGIYRIPFKLTPV